MPRYDYRCTECASEFELVQKFSEAGQGECPDCGGAGRRVFHAVPVIYKGSGFYTTDYGRPKRPAEGSESGREGGAAASESSSASDAAGNGGNGGGSGSGGSGDGGAGAGGSGSAGAGTPAGAGAGGGGSE